jgi:sugar phosphate isomerase/epimerase
MFKLCFNSTTLRNIELFEALNLIKLNGYDGVELTLNDTHLHPYIHSHKRCREVKSYCSDQGIDIVCVAAGGPHLLGEDPYEPSIINPEPAKRRERVDFLKHCMAVAQDLDSPVLNINSGKLRQGMSSVDAYKYIRDGIQELLEQAGDLILVLEPEPDFFIGTTDEAINLIKDIDSPRLRLNLDIGHVFCSENDCYEKIRKALPYARHIHIEDIKGSIHHHEIPGEGDINFKLIMELITLSNYAHYVSVELHHHETMWERALKNSRDYLLQNL